MSARGFSVARFPIVERRGTCRRCGRLGVTVRDHFGVWDCEQCIRRFDLVERGRLRRLARGERWGT